MQDVIKGYHLESVIDGDLINQKYFGYKDLAGFGKAFNQIIVFCLPNLGWGNTNMVVRTNCNSFQVDFSTLLSKYFLIQNRWLNKTYFMNNYRKTNG